MKLEDRIKKQKELIESDSFFRAHGCRVDELNEEHCILSLEITDLERNYHGTFHGAIYYGMADVCTGILAHMDEGAYVTLNGNLNFISTVAEGRVYCESSVLHRGRKTSVLKAEFTDDNGKLLAAGNYTMYCIKR